MKIYVLKRKYRGEKQVKVGMTQNSVSTRLSYAGGGWKCIFSVELGDISKKKTLKYEKLVHRYLGKYQVTLGSYKEIFSCDPMYAAAVVKTITKKSITNTENHLAGPRYRGVTGAYAPWLGLLYFGWYVWMFYAGTNDIISNGWFAFGVLGGSNAILLLLWGIFGRWIDPFFERIDERAMQKIKAAWNIEARAWNDELEVNMLKLEK